MENFTSFQFKAQYFQTSKITDNTKEVWFVLHGYGQLAKYFIRKFQDIASEELVIIAPGGLSRFYLEGFSGRVGATWMTKEDRLIDIDNYINYLEAVYEQVTSSIASKHTIQFTFLGFSQGAATVTRWLQYHSNDFKRLIIWAGSFPYDMNIAKLSHKLNQKSVFMVRGTEDPFIKEEVKEQQQKFINQLGISVRHFTFKGKHELDSNTLQEIAKIN